MKAPKHHQFAPGRESLGRGLQSLALHLADLAMATRGPAATAADPRLALVAQVVREASETLYDCAVEVLAGKTTLRFDSPAEAEANPYPLFEDAIDATTIPTESDPEGQTEIGQVLPMASSDGAGSNSPEPRILESLPGPTSTRVLTVFLVIGRDGKPSYGVRAASLEEATRLNRAYHTGDADLEVRAPGKRKPPGLVFDAAELAAGLRQREERNRGCADDRSAGAGEGRLDPVDDLPRGDGPPDRMRAEEVLRGREGRDCGPDHLPGGQPGGDPGGPAPGPDEPRPRAGRRSRHRGELGLKEREADERPQAEEVCPEAGGEPDRVVIETDLEAVLAAESGADAKQARKPRKPKATRAEAPAVDPRDLYQVVHDAADRTEWKKCHECRGDFEHPHPRPDAGKCHRPRAEVLAIRDIPGDWREAPLWELDLLKAEREGFEDEEGLHTVGMISDHLKAHGWTFLHQEPSRVYEALAHFKDQVERNHRIAEERRVAEAKPKATRKPRAPRSERRPHA